MLQTMFAGAWGVFLAGALAGLCLAGLLVWAFLPRVRGRLIVNDDLPRQQGVRLELPPEAVEKGNDTVLVKVVHVREGRDG